MLTPVSVALPPVAQPRDPFEVMAEIAFHIENLGYTDKEWNYNFHSGFLKTMKRIREIVQETKP